MARDHLAKKAEYNDVKGHEAYVEPALSIAQESRLVREQRGL